jgi:hypothetical protein
MQLKITRGKVEFNTSEYGNDKEVVFVEFPNCISTTTNRPFKWMPTYEQLNEIGRALDEIERVSWEEGEEEDGTNE